MCYYSLQLLVDIFLACHLLQLIYQDEIFYHNATGRVIPELITLEIP